MADEVEVVDEAPEVEVSPTVVVVDNDDSGNIIDDTTIDLVTRVTRLEDAIAVIAAGVEGNSNAIAELGYRIEAAQATAEVAIEAVEDTQEVIAETAEATPTKEDDEVVDEAPRNVRHWWYRGRGEK